MKNRLSFYLRQVRDGGDSLFVTDHGEIIAELRPAPKANRRVSERAALLAMATRGEVSIGSGSFTDFAPIRPKRGTKLSRVVIEQRR